MKIITEEITLTYNSNQIVTIEISEGVTGLILEGSLQVLPAVNKIYNRGDIPKATLILMPSFYISKDVLKAYASNSAMKHVAFAVVSNSFTSKLIGGVLLKVRERMYIANNRSLVPSKMFRDREKAVEWLLEELKN